MCPHAAGQQAAAGNATAAWVPQNTDGLGGEAFRSVCVAPSPRPTVAPSPRGQLRCLVVW